MPPGWLALTRAPASSERNRSAAHTATRLMPTAMTSRQAKRIG
jgi:hypothetical protein